MTDERAEGTGAEPGFDESLARLEAIVAELEQGGDDASGGGGLEASLARYREGVALLNGCREKLATFRKQVEELSADGVTPYDGDPDGDPDGGDDPF